MNSKIKDCDEESFKRVRRGKNTQKSKRITFDTFEKKKFQREDIIKANENSLLKDINIIKKRKKLSN